ncbi:CHAT domain-containing protein [Streptomyces cyaneofuscatus]|uniref:CHAT domain-containing protein n=1 Tax=Streptomyces cyaneofuscatus TaxID=66883 RepID=UPI0036DEDCFE
MDDQESYQNRSYGTWVTEAGRRADLCFPYADSGRPSVAYAGSIPLLDIVVSEMSKLLRLLIPGTASHCAVQMRLGAALVMRSLVGGGVVKDRKEARRLLHDVRASPRTVPEDRRWAGLFLLMLVFPPKDMRRRTGALGAPAPYVRQTGADLRKPGAVEKLRLAANDAAELPLPAHVLDDVRRMGTLLSECSPLTAGNPVEQLKSLLAQDFPQFDEMFPGQDDAPIILPDADDEAMSGTEDDFDLMNASFFAAAVPRYKEMLRTADPAAWIESLDEMAAMREKLDFDDELNDVYDMVSLCVMDRVSHYSGNLHDLQLVRDRLAAVAERMIERGATSTSASTREMALQARIYLSVRQVWNAETPEDVRTPVDALLNLEETIDAAHALRLSVTLGLGMACIRLSSLGCSDDASALLPYLKEAQSIEEQLYRIDPEENLEPSQYFIEVMESELTGEPLPDVAPPRPDGGLEERLMYARLMVQQHEREDSRTAPHVFPDRGTITRALEELDQLRAAVHADRTPYLAGEILWHWARAHRYRWYPSPSALRASVDAAIEALRYMAADVVLQQGAEHGLTKATDCADRGVRTALWASSLDRQQDALDALELGRAMVLRAASTSRAVPELLEALGRHELAEAWRAVAPDDAEVHVPTDALPSALRRQALEALGYQEHGGLLATPRLDELIAAVTSSRADALVYLVPGTGGDDGMALVVSHAGVHRIALSPLSVTGSAPLELYLDAAAEQNDSEDGTETALSWEDALAELCGWAYGVMGPILKEIADRRTGHRSPAEPPRIVLIPCGKLGLVPWHSTRMPEDDPHDFLCQAAVVSYAASGSQFLRTVRRAPRDPADAPVLVADPSSDLDNAQREVLALRQAYYPQARLYGAYSAVPALPETEGTPDVTSDKPPKGTPEEILDALAGGASLVHLATHGSEGPRPTRSALYLASPRPPRDSRGEKDTPGTQPNPGMLTVTRLLDLPAGESGAKDGPLVVLSACETDLSSRQHDEALTLTTAFIANGARDVVGSRWTTDDGLSVLFMAVFHHYLSIEHRSPVDALRATQLWMLDPDRTDPGSLPVNLVRDITQPELSLPSVWATFIHQGHPGPAPIRTRHPDRHASRPADTARQAGRTPHRSTT